jgi:hypothetical protein
MSPNRSGINEDDVPSTAPRAWALCKINAPHIFWRGGGRLPVLYTSKTAAERALATSSFPNMAAHYVPVPVCILVVKAPTPRS